jgi:cytochrome oxidase Cu insertion factor (SCO1/SenC/PrrC family)
MPRMPGAPRRRPKNGSRSNGCTLHAVRKRFIAIALLIMVAAATGAQTPAPDLETIGPKVGTRVASFTLPDQNGQPRSLESLIGPKGAILVFFRSADW